MNIYHETLRDRLIELFESRNLIHKPKLIGVTSVDTGAGVTAIASGLARSLSETGEGNVLLVDMTQGQGSTQHFVNGQPECDLDRVLDSRAHGKVQDNLYVVSENPNGSQLARNLPRRFSRLVPRLKASDFDYIIFDLPPVSPVSVTPRVAGFMDSVVMVIESEKSDREIVQGAVDLLKDSKASIGAVLNKTKTHVPAFLLKEFHQRV